jgi:hypothetical protein
MQESEIESIVIKTENESVFFNLEKFCEKNKISLTRVFNDYEIKTSESQIFVIDRVTHKYKNVIYYDMFNSLPYDWDKIKAVFVIGKKIKGKSGILKKTYFVNPDNIDVTLIGVLGGLLEKKNNGRPDIFLHKLARMLEFEEMKNKFGKVNRQEFCKRHNVCKRTLERDIKIVKLISNELINLNSTDLLTIRHLSETGNVMSGRRAKRIFRIMYLHLHIIRYNEIESEKFCKYFNISQRTFGRDVLTLNTVLKDRQIEGFGGVFC